MRTANILKIITNTSVAVCVGAMSLFGGVAHAETFQQRVQAELNSGKDYAAAWAAASRATGPLYAPDLAADAKKAQAALNQGKDYVAAWDAGSRRTEPVFSTEQVAKAQKAKVKMNEGKDYSAAWEATTNEQSTARVRAASKRVSANGHERTRSTK
jgi:hypothetical protein